MLEPRVTVILPARNEEAKIAGAVETLAAQPAPREGEQGEVG
ncbi:MAG: hypothetical protein ACE5IP_08115 [Terriglobia bacterium]